MLLAQIAERVTDESWMCLKFFKRISKRSWYWSKFHTATMESLTMFYHLFRWLFRISSRLLDLIFHKNEHLYSFVRQIKEIKIVGNFRMKILKEIKINTWCFTLKENKNNFFKIFIVKASIIINYMFRKVTLLIMSNQVNNLTRLFYNLANKWS